MCVCVCVLMCMCVHAYTHCTYSVHTHIMHYSSMRDCVREGKKETMRITKQAVTVIHIPRDPAVGWHMTYMYNVHVVHVVHVVPVPVVQWLQWGSLVIMWMCGGGLGAD